MSRPSIPRMIRARWIEIGASTPQTFHDTYRCAALAQPKDAPPIVFWGKAPPHICLGAHQARAAELAPACACQVARRSLGGGAVWLDHNQYCFIIVVPAASWGAPRNWFGCGLRPLVATYREFGLPVAPRGHDVWLDEKKIAGSGAATLGNSAVFASSFLLKFDSRSFVDAIACPSHEYREMLRYALREAMTGWEAHAEPPRETIIKTAFREIVATSFHWHIDDDKLLNHERCNVRNDNDADIDEENSGGAKAVRNGIKINHETFLLQAVYAEATLTLLKSSSTLVDIALPGIVSPAMRAYISGTRLSDSALEAKFRHGLSPGQSTLWAQRVVDLAEGKSAYG